MYTMLTKNTLLFLLVTGLFLSSFVIEAELVTADTHVIESNSFDYSPFISAVNISAIKEHVNFFTSLKTRATGYIGNRKAAEYIQQKFIEYGLVNVSREPFQVVDCISYGANITFLDTGEIVPIHPILPNFIIPSTTPPEGITGKLIYGGTGEIKELDGKEVNGSIVLLEWDSGANWLNVANLGAKAVIFLPPKIQESVFSLYGVAGENELYPGPVTKWLWNTPLNFPRFYVEDANADILMSNLGRTVVLKSTHRWTEVTSWNVVGFVEGKDRPEGIIVLSSYYDSYSMAPSIAPGAQESLGISTLLELARYFAKPENKPPLTIMFVAFGGHHQALAGARHFVNEYYFPAPNITKRQIGPRIWYVTNLDISTGTKRVLFTVDGNTFQTSGFDGDFGLRDYGEIFDPILREYFSELNAQMGGKYEAYIKVGYISKEDCDMTAIPNNMATKLLAYDHEPFSVLPYPPHAWTITTGYDARPYYRTPFDTVEKINWENLKTQLECIYSILLRSIYSWTDFPLVKINREGFRDFWWPHYGVEPDGDGVGIIYGRVAVWDETKGSWKVLTRSDLESLPNPIVFFRGSHPLDRRFIFANDDGTFAIKTNLSPYAKSPWEISVWVVDPETGNIVFAPDQGRHKYPAKFPAVHKTEDEVEERDMPLFTVFKASTLAILDLTGSTDIRKAEDFSPVDSYSVWFEDVSGSRIYVLAFPPQESIVLPNFILTNASKDALLGRGFCLQPGTQKIVNLSFLKCAEDTHYLNTYYINRLVEKGIDVTRELFYTEYLEGEEKIKEAYKALLQRNYSKAYVLAAEALTLERRVHGSIEGFGTEVISAIPLLYFLLIPFAVLFEKLTFNQKGVRKAFTLAGISVALMLILSLLHPGLFMSAYPLALISSFCVILTSALTLIIILRDITGFLSEVRIKRLGTHEIKVSRTELAVHSFMTGVENMRRRAFRTVLILISVSLLVSSVVSFVSLTPVTLETYAEYRIGAPLYDGILIRRFEWGHGNSEIGRAAMEYLKAKYGDNSTFIPIAWKYTLWPTMQSITINDIGFTVGREDKYIYPKALLGLPPEAESLLSPFLKERSRWFIPEDTKACILSERQAKKLGIEAKDLPVKIFVETMSFRVIGIISDDYDLIKNLDGESITPVKRDFPPGIENPWDEHLTSDEVLIVPYKEAIRLGGMTAALSIITRPSEVRSIGNEIQENINTLSISSNIDVYSNLGGVVVMHGEMTRVTLTGIGFQLVPTIIVMLILLNSILGSVQERKGEIKTYSAIGLSPLHVAILFLSESIVYGILGTTIGYVLAMVQFRIYEALTGTQIANYSSNMIFLAVTLSIVSVVIAALYPAFLSGRLVTPSLERSWRIPTKPFGELWNIPLPFLTSSRTETKGVMAYLSEFLREHSIPDAPDFMASNIQIEECTLENKPALKIRSDVRLAPYNVGVTQEVEVISLGKEPSRWEFIIQIRKTSGPTRDWIRLNRTFIDLIRKQLLLWRTLPDQEKKRYATY